MIFVVMNNRAHGTIADLETANFGSGFGCEFRDQDGLPYSPDFAAMARSFADRHLGCAERPEGIEGGRNHGDVGVDARLRIEFDQVRFQQHALSAYIEAALFDAFQDARDEIFGVGFRFDHRNNGLGLR